MLVLPPRCDVMAATVTATELKAADNLLSDLTVTGKSVVSSSTAMIQLLAATAKTCRDTGKLLSLVDISPTLHDDITLLGLSDLLMGER